MKLFDKIEYNLSCAKTNAHILSSCLIIDAKDAKARAAGKFKKHQSVIDGSYTSSDYNPTPTSTDGEQIFYNGLYAEQQAEAAKTSTIGTMAEKHRDTTDVTKDTIETVHKNRQGPEDVAARLESLSDELDALFGGGMTEIPVVNTSKKGVSEWIKDGGLSRERKVTGKELNEVSSQIIKHLNDIKGLQRKFIGEFGHIYDVLDALDRDYLSAIKNSMDALNCTSDGVKMNQDRIAEMAGALEKMLEMLTKLKLESCDPQATEMKEEGEKNDLSIDKNKEQADTTVQHLT